MDYNGCTCMALDAREALDAWRRRAMPIIARWMAHGHRINPVDMQKTLELVSRLERGYEACFDDKNAHKSHHLHGCPAARRSVGMVCRLTRKPPAVLVMPSTARRLTTWAEQTDRFLGASPIHAAS